METNQTTAKQFSPSYDGGLEITEMYLGDHADEREFRISLKKNGAFVAMTRSSVDANMIAAMPDLLASVKLAARRACNDLQMWAHSDIGSIEFKSLENAHAKYCAAIAKAEGRA